MNIPANFRKQLPDGQGDSSVYITLNQAGSFSYLSLLPQDYFQAVSQAASDRSGGPFEPNLDEMIKLANMMDGAQECRYDDQGRLIVPKKFLEAAGIQGHVHILGMHAYVQLWNPEAFDRFRKTAKPAVTGPVTEPGPA
jgi:DNA-binding transcriptional regulator/RsmH inhibitor MraZ